VSSAHEDAGEHVALPGDQHDWEGLPRLSERDLYVRRERLFIVFAGLFLGTLAMLNILGISRFIDLSVDLGGFRLPLVLPVGVLPYPLTFLCTDFISELYGRRRANFVVTVGLLLNVWVVFILWLGGALPGVANEPPPAENVFFQVRALAFGAVTASMIAYLAAQYVDVQLFHFWKRLTKGKMLWVRNNGSTLVSQLVDTVAVTLVTFASLDAVPGDPETSVLWRLLVLIYSGYAFKLVTALLDTVPFILGTHQLVKYLRLPPPGYEAEAETARAVEPAPA
jgi:uncharacterized integral membrane protein (TIGR00697 family)